MFKKLILSALAIFFSFFISTAGAAGTIMEYMNSNPEKVPPQDIALPVEGKNLLLIAWQQILDDMFPFITAKQGEGFMVISESVEKIINEEEGGNLQEKIKNYIERQVGPLSAIVLGIEPGIMGDFDRDGDVDSSDLAVFAADFGRTNCDSSPECEGNFNHDKNVDGSDLAIFAANFGRTN